MLRVIIHLKTENYLPIIFSVLRIILEQLLNMKSA